MKTVTTLLVLLMFHNTSLSQSTNVLWGMLQDGEELRYKVKWQFFRLGTITIRAEHNAHDSLYYNISMLVESNPDLPFVSIRDYNVSLVNSQTMKSKEFYATHKNGDEIVEIRHFYDEHTRRTVCTNTDLTTGAILQLDTLVDVPPYVEGPSLFFITRWLSRSKQVVTIPTIASGQMAETVLDFTQGREYIEIDAINEPVRTRKYGGEAKWQGGTSAGLSGEFTGWVSDDEAAIPLRAEMKVLLGSVVIELEQWNRHGWNPPIYVDVVKNE